MELWRDSAVTHVSSYRNVVATVSPLSPPTTPAGVRFRPCGSCGFLIVSSYGIAMHTCTNTVSTSC